jgi:hypothetical protein
VRALSRTGHAGRPVRRTPPSSHRPVDAPRGCPPRGRAARSCACRTSFAFGARGSRELG